MRKPSNVLYGFDERAPRLVTVLSGLQHVGAMSMYLLYPVLVARAANAPPEVAASMVSLTLLAMAIGTILQDFRFGPVGSGYLCQPIPSVVYLLPSLLAARTGGLEVVFGMTIAAGLLEMAMSRVLRRLRPIFPPEIVGLVILLVGVATGLVGLRLVFGDSHSHRGVDGPSVELIELVVGFVTLAIMAGLNIWNRGYLRIFCVLIGMAAGYALSGSLGILSPGDMDVIAKAPVVALPTFGHLGWSFDPTLLLPFGVAAVAATLKVMGNVTTLQKANDADWIRPGMTQVMGGVLADGLGTVVAGSIGAQGLNSSPTVVGLAAASGVLSRYVAIPVAVLLAALAFLPKVGAVAYLMPRTVAAAALVFSSTFIIVNGIQVMTSRLLDTRKTVLIGIALLAGLAVDAEPSVLRFFPENWKAVLGTSLVLGTVVGLVLNLIFRMGVKRARSLTIAPGHVDPARIEEFLQESGEQWGARADVIERAKFNLVQSIEAIVEGCQPREPLEVEATFDEFNVDIRVSYNGPLIELPDKRPSNEEIMESEDGHRRLAGFMLRRHADRVSATQKAGRSTVTFHFDH
jgi:NCS2 family nucleobase:cation symporter-2